MGVSGSIFSGSRPLLGRRTTRHMQARKPMLRLQYTRLLTWRRNITHAQVLLQMMTVPAAAAVAAACSFDNQFAHLP
jgi:hypothetical protein